MIRRNTRERETAADDLLRHLNSIQNGKVRSTPTLIPPLNNRQEMNTPPSAPCERRFEKLRKLGATPFHGTLDPTEAEAWLESTDKSDAVYSG